MKTDLMVLLQVFSLPGLELLLAQRMEACLGFPWGWAADQAPRLPAVCAAAADGQLAIVRAYLFCKFLSPRNSSLLCPLFLSPESFCRAMHARAACMTSKL